MNDGDDYVVIKEQQMNGLLDNRILNHWYEYFMHVLYAEQRHVE